MEEAIRKEAAATAARYNHPDTVKCRIELYLNDFAIIAAYLMTIVFDTKLRGKTHVLFTPSAPRFSRIVGMRKERLQTLALPVEIEQAVLRAYRNFPELVGYYNGDTEAIETSLIRCGMESVRIYEDRMEIFSVFRIYI